MRVDVRVRTLLTERYSLRSTKVRRNTITYCGGHASLFTEHAWVTEVHTHTKHANWIMLLTPWRWACSVLTPLLSVSFLAF